MKKRLFWIIIICLLFSIFTFIFAACNDKNPQEAKPLVAKFERYYVRVDADGQVDPTGDHLLFGSYPQTITQDASVTRALLNAAGDLPTAEDNRSWTSYGYVYYASASQPHDVEMWYIDLPYGEEKYRGVYFNTNRRDAIKMTSMYGSGSGSPQERNGYDTASVYWFKYEPIKWRILSEENGEAFILADMIIDGQPFRNDPFNEEKNGKLSSYALSSVRSWLNEDFYNLAFSDLQKQNVLLTTVDNSERSTNPQDNPTKWNTGENANACEDTQDKVFLLSMKEASDPAYGFSSKTYGDKDPKRRKSRTDYAEVQGAYQSNTENNQSTWLLRSPYYEYEGAVNCVADYGYLDGYCFSWDHSLGIVPALRMKAGAKGTVAPTRYSVTLSVVAGEGGSAIGDGEFTPGTTVTLTASVKKGYLFLGWFEGEDNRCQTLTYSFAMPSENKSLTAKFALCQNHALDQYCYCAKCGLTVHTTDENCVCSACGKTVHGATDGGYCRHGSTVYFGSYPQTLVTDNALTGVLLSASGIRPTENRCRNWTSYRYQDEEDNYAKDYMWYIDVPYQGETYRGVYFTSLRPRTTQAQKHSVDGSCQDENGYEEGKFYWFKFEPIQWTLLEEEDGEALLLCDMILDSRVYYPSGETMPFEHNGGVGYYDEYALSNLRLWLNDAFYDTAFAPLQKQIIAMTTVDNGINSVKPHIEHSGWEYGGIHVGDATQDNVFLPSVYEMTDPAYGFNENELEMDAARSKVGTDYAKAQGLNVTERSRGVINAYWTRTPRYAVRDDGMMVDSMSSVCGYVGVVPALRIRLN